MYGTEPGALLAQLLEVYRTVHYRKPSCFYDERQNEQRCLPDRNSCQHSNHPRALPAAGTRPRQGETPILFWSVLLLAIVTISACSAAPPKPNIEHMLATAQTASDHQAIAQYYENEAADAHAKYEEHNASAVHYRNNPKWGSWAWHCDRLAQDFKGVEQDASVLAAQHRKIAEEMNSGRESPAK